MNQEHRLGVHVTSDERDNYGEAAPHLAVVCSLVDGAFSEVPAKTIKIFRTQKLRNHVDIAGDFDQLPDDELEAVGLYWWDKLVEIYRPVKQQYENVYFQPINEINNARTIPYLRGMVKGAERDGFKLALWGDAGDSPSDSDFQNHWIPFMKEVQDGGHIYCCHAYSYVNTEQDYLINGEGWFSDANSERPYIKMRQMIEAGVSMPMVIGELGWRAGWNELPEYWLEDALEWDQTMRQFPQYIGACLWNAGQWETAPNILSGEPLRKLGAELSTMTTDFWDPTKPVDIGVPFGQAGPLESLIYDPKDFDYHAQIYLLPQDVPISRIATAPEWAGIFGEFDKKRRTFTWSHHDAVSSAMMASSAVVRIYGDRPEAVELCERYFLNYEVLERPDANTGQQVPEEKTLDGLLNGLVLGQPVNAPWAITDRFNSPRSYGNGKHEGIDLDVTNTTGDSKASVLCMLAGTVVKTEVKSWGYGLNVWVKGYYRGVPITMIYAHLDKIYAREGQSVTLGQPLGEIGNTGNSTGEHLHLTGIAPAGYGLSGYVNDSFPNVFDITPYMPKSNYVAGKRFNLVDYVIGDGRIYNLKSFGAVRPDGTRAENNERCQMQFDGIYTYQSKNEFWEQMQVTQTHIRRLIDCSAGNDEMYAMWDLNNNAGANWLPVTMAIGELFTRSAYVQRFTFDGRPVSSRSLVTDTMRLTAHHPTFSGLNGVVINDVLEIDWMSGEKYFYGKGFGLVGWGRSHNDPHTPQGSRVSEIINGQGPNRRIEVANVYGGDFAA